MVLEEIQVHDQLLVVLVEEVLGQEFQMLVLVTLQVHHQVKVIMVVMVVDNLLCVFMEVLEEVLVQLVVRQTLVHLLLLVVMVEMEQHHQLQVLQ